MTEDVRSLLVALVAVALVVSPWSAFVGVAGGTVVQPVDNGGSDAVYPGQTVSVLNVSVESEDEILLHENSFEGHIGEPGSAFLIQPEGRSEVFVDGGGGKDGIFSSDDSVLGINMLSGPTDGGISASKLQLFSDGHLYIDYADNFQYAPEDPIIYDEDLDGSLTQTDTILRGGTTALRSFEGTGNTEVFIDENSDSIFGETEAVLSVEAAGELSSGPLESGKTILLRKGVAPIRDFESIAGDQYFVNSIGSSDFPEYNDGEAIVVEDGDGILGKGQLSSGDYVIRDGDSNLEPFLVGKSFFLNTVDPNTNGYSPSEPIIRDSGYIEGEIDGSDEIILSGTGRVSDFSDGIATYGTGDVYIGKSDDGIFDGAEFIYVEDGTSGGYNVGEDLVIATSEGTVPTGDTTQTTQVTATEYTDIGYLDLNDNGQFDSHSENNALTGAEPVIQFPLPRQSVASEKLESDTQLLVAFEQDPGVLDIGGKWLSEGKFLDISQSPGPYENGEIRYVDQNRDELFQKGEFLIEIGDSPSKLSSGDYILRKSDVSDLAAHRVYDELEYLDTGQGSGFDDGDYIIESENPNDEILTEKDKIISPTSSNIGYKLPSYYEFIDSNHDGEYNKRETIISSTESGDLHLENSDSIHMGDVLPGGAKLRNFAGTTDIGSVSEAYADTGSAEYEFDDGDIVINASVEHSGDKEELVGEIMRDFSSDKRYIDSSTDQEYSSGELIFLENDRTDGQVLFADHVTALTVTNHGTVPTSAIESVAVQRNGTTIASATTATDGTWVLEPDAEDGIIAADRPTHLTVSATLAADAPVGETVDFELAAVEDGGVAGAYDPGDTGLFFADGAPVGGFGTGPSYSVADPSAIGASATAVPDPDRNGTAAIELAFTDDIDPDSTAPSDFAVENVLGAGVNVTGLRDDDADGRLVLELESGTAPETIASVGVEAGAMAVASGAAVPAQSFALETTSVAVTEAATRPQVVYRGERLGVLANDGPNGTANLDEAVRIDGDTTDDGTFDELVQLGSTGPASALLQVDTNASNASRYRVAFESDDGDSGQTVTVPVRNLSLSVTANRTNTTDVAGPINATVSAAGRGRVLRTDLLEAENGTVLDSQLVRLDEQGNATVAFPPRVANVTIAVTDLGTGLTDRTANVTVRKGYPGATFERDVFEQERGDVAHIGVRLVDTETATVAIGGESVNYHERVTVVDGNGDGRATIALNTHRAGSNGTGVGIGLRPNGTETRPADRIVGVERDAPAAPGLREPLEVAEYALEATVDGEVTDLAMMQLGDRATSGASTLVAPAGVSLESADDVRNWTTARETVAVGDQAVVAVNATGLGGVLDEHTDLRRSGPTVAKTGAYVDVERGNPPPNRPARHLNVSNASTVIDRQDDVLYVVLRSDEDAYTVAAGERFDATFVLNESSPYVLGATTPDVVERESASTVVAFETPSGGFTDLDENETLDLPASASATVAGETNLAPGTNVTVAVVADDENVTFRETDTDRVADDGSFGGTVDLEEYPEGTDYTVVATANGDDLTAVRTGTIVEAPVTLDAAQNVSAAGATGGGSGSRSVERTTRTGTTTRTTTETPTDDSVGERARRLVTEDVPAFIATQATNIVVGLGMLAVLYGLLGLRRLTR